MGFQYTEFRRFPCFAKIMYIAYCGCSISKFILFPSPFTYIIQFKCDCAAQLIAIYTSNNAIYMKCNINSKYSSKCWNCVWKTHKNCVFLIRYICSLAVGDMVVILFCVPFTSTVYTVESWPYGLIVCKFSEFIKDVSIGVSVFTLTALSADRYLAIVDPMRKLQGKRATEITTLSITGICTTLHYQ